jgi:hypothetical protein
MTMTMQRSRRMLCSLALLAGLASSRLVHAAEGEMSAGPSRVDFDDRLIKGQRQGTGSVYIFERQKVDLKSMVKKIHSFRERIILTVFEE